MRDFFVYMLFRLFSLVCHLVGPRGAVAVGYLVGLGIAATDHRAARLLGHMARAVGWKRARNLLKRYHEHLGLIGVECARLDTYDPARVREWMEPVGLEKVREALARGKGVILVMGHLGNWELTLLGLVAYGIPLGVLYRPLKNRHLDRYLRGARERGGVAVHRKEDGVRFVLRTVRAKEACGILIDQDAGSMGVHVPFFGKLASTLPTAVRLARRTGSAILPVTSFRLPDRTRHMLHVGPEIVPVKTGGKTGGRNDERDVLITTRLCNRAIEEAILEAPAQWVWAHRRWRHRPGEAEVAAWEEAARHLARPT